MTYDQTLDFLFHRLPMFSRIGAAAIKADLTNTLKLCDQLGDPQHAFPSIHIAGTNGKGSTSHMLAAILQQAGYKTGLYTSPHLRDFRERIRINGKMIDQQQVVDFVSGVTDMINEIEPSFFELTVAMAFDYFKKEKVDIAIIEVGLGGRLDSTNVILPQLSIITSIGWDHMNVLGNSIEAIAIEKAGIIKSGIPVIMGPVQFPEAIEVIKQKAIEQQAPLIDASRRFAMQDAVTGIELMHITAYDNENALEIPYILDLPGAYQQYNLPGVLCACDELRRQGWNLPDDVVHSALQQVKKLTGFAGRCETIHESPRIVLDVAHNEDGIRALVSQFMDQDDENHGEGQLHIVIGMVRDKEVEKILLLLPTGALYYFTRAQIPRALPELELTAKAKSVGLSGNAYPDVNEALQAALLASNQSDTILVCGSVFVVGEVDLEAIANRAAQQSKKTSSRVRTS